LRNIKGDEVDIAQPRRILPHSIRITPTDLEGKKCDLQSIQKIYAKYQEAENVCATLFPAPLNDQENNEAKPCQRPDVYSEIVKINIHTKFVAVQPKLVY
jgi:hypothetical protein